MSVHARQKTKLRFILMMTLLGYGEKGSAPGPKRKERKSRHEKDGKKKRQGPKFCLVKERINCFISVIWVLNLESWGHPAIPLPIVIV